MKALAIICRTPNDILCSFYNNFEKKYDVFMIIDTDHYDSKYFQHKYQNITFVQVDADRCLENYIKNTNNTAVIRKTVAGWDKALYYFIHDRRQYNHVWFLEDDVFIYDVETLLNIDMKYKNYDLICNSMFEEGKSDTWLWQSIDISIPPPYYCGMCCASRLSRNMLEAINTYAQRFKTLFFIEALLPTIVKYFNLRSIKSPEELQTVTYNRKWDFPRDFKKTGIFHPVKKPEDHLLIRDHLNNDQTI